MKTKYFLPVAAIAFAACSEPTSPVDFDIAAAKQAPPPSAPAGESFENGLASLGAWTPSSLATSPGSAVKGPTTFLGRFADEVVSLTVPAGSSSVTLTFDLYIIGSWDGAGQQGFGADHWQIEVQKGDGPRENVFHTSFSNQATKPQNYPNQITQKGTGPNGKGALALNALGYPKASGKFDVGDSIYRLSYTVANPGAERMVFFFHTTTPLQPGGDESWGLDNVAVTGN